MMLTTSETNNNSEDEIIFIGKIQRPSSSSNDDSIELIKTVKPNSQAINNNVDIILEKSIQKCQDVEVEIISSSDEISQSSLSKKNFPNKESSSPSFISNNNEIENYTAQCSICLEQYGEIDSSHHMVALKCGHVFGKECIEKWLKPKNNRKCPNCKKHASIKEMIKIYTDNLPANNSIWRKYNDAIKKLEECMEENKKLKKMKKK